MPLPLPAPIAHQAEGQDPYAWLQQRDTPEVLAYLEAENAYQQAGSSAWPAACSSC